jgi:hypothetical protein
MNVGIGTEATEVEQFLFWDYFFEFSVLCLCSAVAHDYIRRQISYKLVYVQWRASWTN